MRNERRRENNDESLEEWIGGTEWGGCLRLFFAAESVKPNSLLTQTATGTISRVARQ